MKPFDLERARAGDPICLRRTSANITFIGVERSGDMVIQFDNGELEIAIQSDLRMAPKVTTYYVNIYKNAIDNRPIIGNILHENKEDAEQVSSHDCTYVKTISFELEQ